MKVEAPEIKRCCFCVPLRYGLLAWGYIKLILTMLLLIPMCIKLAMFAMESSKYSFRTTEVLVLTTFILVVIVDFSFTIMFLIGGHRKTAKLLYIFYIYSIVNLCVFGIFYAWATATDLYYVAKYMHDVPEGHFAMGFVIQMRIFIGFFSFGVQMYIILMIKTEINKLRNNSKYRFSNIAAQDQSAFENGVSEEGIEAGTENTEQKPVGINNNANNVKNNKLVGIMNKVTGINERDSYNYNKF